MKVVAEVVMTVPLTEKLKVPDPLLVPAGMPKFSTILEELPLLVTVGVAPDASAVTVPIAMVAGPAGPVAPVGPVSPCTASSTEGFEADRLVNVAPRVVKNKTTGNNAPALYPDGENVNVDIPEDATPGAT